MTAVRPHDLLRLSRRRSVLPVGTPVWVASALATTPWVVVRRAPATAADRIAVGVCGPVRALRCALEIPAEWVAEALRPEELATRLGRANRDLPALHTLHAAASLIQGCVDLPWGPTGSVGFELATGMPAVTATSDLDLLIRSARLPIRGVAERLHAALGELPARVDCLIETDQGAVALGDLAASTTEVLLRTADGPRLVTVARETAG
ncbi:malonate decarboxylase holo-ACP synthase [Streptomyces griseiscabiei]|uniref:Malonate decarboxylase holo-ACP synthase n=1 Tax=Streptomyces griseiscabiei TaxID=2993540 RepID=A0ABU4LLI0_9ACTN|nr:malonate decarboxylase holo-ACP synthase [Streptomyces griseiscabiei]MBZ3900362.1 malonate decarboxylase holo-ACP synthase [Streptomyces griseiscabiei]MDX2916306.1 malonate decarboxylase holo-ACP synthase [Streptomyces griseiscabiei]